MERSNVDFTFHTPNWTLKMKSSLSQFSDLFSEFSKYIAPAYHHDSCERSVQMRLYTMHKREFFLVFIVFLACFWLFIFIGLAGPAVTVTVTKYALNLEFPVNKSQLLTGPLIIQTPTLSTYSQQLWITAKILKESNDVETIQMKFYVALTIQGVVDEQNRFPVLTGQNLHNRTRELTCREQVCSEFTVLHLGFLDFSRYIISIQFYGLEPLEQKYPIKDIVFYFRSYNPAFTQIEIWFRFIFVLLTFIVTCWFSHRLRKFSFRDWSIEQKWLSILLPLLVLYNDPIFPLTLLLNNWIPGLLDAIFQASFLCTLLLFWLCIYHGIRQNERYFITFYLPKVILVGMLWMASVTLASWHKFNERRDPTYNYTLDTQNYNGFKLFFFIAGGMYMVYLLYLIVRAYSELRNMPYFDVRLKFLTTLMLFVISISIAITVMRFGVQVLQDNFISELTTNYKNSAEFMAYYGLLNLYLYVMAFVYSPSPNAVLDSHYKDNPTFSMINDSDEEVVYGSDTEDKLLSCAKDHEESD
ncbi:hypothetical protein CHUAL_012023 [Chamberlinius hualienensis]